MDGIQNDLPNFGLALLSLLMFFTIIYMAISKLRDRKFKEELAKALQYEDNLYVLQIPERELEKFTDLVEKLNGRALRGKCVTIEVGQGVRVKNWYFESLVEAVNSTLLIHSASHNMPLLSHRILGREGCYINTGGVFKI